MAVSAHMLNIIMNGQWSIQYDEGLDICVGFEQTLYRNHVLNILCKRLQAHTTYIEDKTKFMVSGQLALMGKIFSTVNSSSFL